MGNNIQIERDIINRVAEIFIGDTTCTVVDYESFITTARFDVIALLTNTNEFKNLPYVKQIAIRRYLTYQTFEQQPPDELVIYRNKILAEYKKKEEEKTNSFTYESVTIQPDGQTTKTSITEFYTIYAHASFNNALVFTCDQLRNCKCTYANGVFIC